MHRFGNGRVSEKALKRKQDFAVVANIVQTSNTRWVRETHIHKNQNWISTTFTSKTAGNEEINKFQNLYNSTRYTSID